HQELLPRRRRADEPALPALPPLARGNGLRRVPSLRHRSHGGVPRRPPPRRRDAPDRRRAALACSRLMDRLPRAFYARDTPVVAPDLLGKLIVSQVGRALFVVRIVETEAYHGPDDTASHARRGPTPRSTIMFGEPGRAYIYLIYGVWNCLNLVTGETGFPSAGLDRAREPPGPG